MDFDDMLSYHSNHTSNSLIPITSNLSLSKYVERYTNISFNSLSEIEKKYISKNINLDECHITNISKLKSGKLITLVMSDFPDHYKLVNTYRHYYLVKWKKTNGDYYCTINVHKPYLSVNGVDCSFFAKKEDYKGYVNGMGCEFVDIQELLVPNGTERVIDNSDYYSSFEEDKEDSLITDDNIIDTSIFFKKEDV